MNWINGGFMSRCLSNVRKEVEKEAFEFFNLNSSIKTKEEVDNKLLSINKGYKRERLINTSLLMLCFLVFAFSFKVLSMTKGNDPIFTIPSIVFIFLSIFAFIAPTLCFFHLVSSRKDATAFNFYRNDYYGPVNINLPRIAAGISNMLLDCELAVVNKEILAQGRSVTLAEHLLMWKTYQESEDFLSKKEAVCDMGLAKRKEEAKQDGESS